MCRPFSSQPGNPSSSQRALGSGRVLGSKPEHDVCGQGDGVGEYPRTPLLRVARRRRFFRRSNSLGNATQDPTAIIAGLDHPEESNPPECFSDLRTLLTKQGRSFALILIAGFHRQPHRAFADLR